MQLEWGFLLLLHYVRDDGCQLLVLCSNAYTALQLPAAGGSAKHHLAGTCLS